MMNDSIKSVQTEEKTLPKTIETVADLIKWLQSYPPELGLDIRYDSGYGTGWIDPSSFTVYDGLLKIEVS